MNGVADVLAERERIDASVARDRERLRQAVEAAGNCEKCKERAFWDMDEWAEILEHAIEEAISSVSVYLLFIAVKD